MDHPKSILENVFHCVTDLKHALSAETRGVEAVVLTMEEMSMQEFLEICKKKHTEFDEVLSAVKEIREYLHKKLQLSHADLEKFQTNVLTDALSMLRLPSIPSSPTHKSLRTAKEHLRRLSRNETVQGEFS